MIEDITSKLLNGPLKGSAASHVTLLARHIQESPVDVARVLVIMEKDGLVERARITAGNPLRWRRIT